MSRNDERRERKLRAEERALWRDVTRSVAPLRGKTVEMEPESAVPEPPVVAQPIPKSAQPRSPRKPRVEAPPSAPALAPLGRRFKQQVARGTQSIEARIDLHGMTQHEAHIALSRFLYRAQADGVKIALVITGKGKRLDDETRERGVLRRQVPLWLKLPEFRALVIGFDEAHLGHGGEGALYVRVRRGGRS